MLSKRLDRKKIGLFVYHLEEIRKCISNWVEFAARDTQVGYWNLNHIAKICKLMSSKVGAESKIPGFFKIR